MVCARTVLLNYKKIQRKKKHNPCSIKISKEVMREEIYFLGLARANTLRIL